MCIVKNELRTRYMVVKILLACWGRFVRQSIYQYIRPRVIPFLKNVTLHMLASILVIIYYVAKSYYLWTSQAHTSTPINHIQNFRLEVCYFYQHLFRVMYYDAPGVAIWTSHNRVSLPLTHWGRETHICVGKLTIIGSDNGLSPGRRQPVIWTNAGILLIRTLGTNFSEILGEVH